MARLAPVLLAAFFTLLLAAPALSAPSFKVDFQLPLGVRYKEVYVQPGAILVGWLTISEVGYPGVDVCVRLTLPSGFRVEYSSLRLRPAGDVYEARFHLRETVPRTWCFALRVPEDLGVYRVEVNVVASLGGRSVYGKSFTRILAVGKPAGIRAKIAVRAPCNPDGSYDPRTCNGVLVVEEFSENPILYFLGIAGKYTSLVGFLRIDVDLGSNASLLPVTLEATLISADGKPAKGISLVHPGFESGAAEAGARLTTYVKADKSGRLSVVVPVLALRGLDEVEGDYSLRVRVRRLGSSIELGEAEFPVKIVVIRRGDIGCLLVGVASAITLLTAVFLDAFRRLSTLEVAYAALSASLAFAVTAIPGTIVWPIAQAILGPFDWVLTGVLYAFLMYAIYGAMVKTAPRPGVFTLAITTKWLLYLFVFGARNPFVSLIWLATTAFIMEPLLYIFGGTRRGATLGIALAFALGRFVDAYVDMNLYMIFYRLFYAQWYINIYCFGVSIYTFAGAALGCKLAEKLRGVSHE